MASEQSHICKECGRYCKNNRSLAIHKRAHDKEYHKKASERAKALWQDKDIKEKRVQGINNYWKVEEHHEKLRKIQKIVCNKEDYKAELSKRQKILLNTEKHHEIQSKAMKKAWSDPIKREHFVATAHSKEANAKRSESSRRSQLARLDSMTDEEYKRWHVSNLLGKRSTIINKSGASIRCDSSYENAFASMCIKDKAVEDIFRFRHFIKYTFEGKERRYNPDFIVHMTNGNLEMIEIKSDYTITDDRVSTKTAAAIDYCKAHNMHFAIFANAYLDLYKNTGNLETVLSKYNANECR